MFIIFIRELRLGLYHLSDDTETIVNGSKLKKILEDTIDVRSIQLENRGERGLKVCKDLPVVARSPTAGDYFLKERIT